MKTDLNRNIKSIRDVQTFLFELAQNNELWNPDDDPNDILWEKQDKVSQKDIKKLQKLRDQIWEHRGKMDVHGFIIDVLQDKDLSETTLDKELEQYIRAYQADEENEYSDNLFPIYYMLPLAVQMVVLSFDEMAPNRFVECERIQQELNNLGYDCDYDMSGEPYDLQIKSLTDE